MTCAAIEEDDESIALVAIESWSTICDEEIDTFEGYANNLLADFDVVCYNFIRSHHNHFLPLLLEMLSKQEEVSSNLAIAGGTCLGLIARTVGDDILPLVTPFIEENIKNADWRLKEAAIYAFGSIMEGPSPKILAHISIVLRYSTI
ncbi:hypothetical protein RD792_013038 [Penstemon davidsonii]|uniref:Uncharacterized protein n=1 Tax=Penstemon davidsonii TaxID=160366 RepID=A0ABR0CT78_9LAMI|nr:hypothetical protein RD792_013038 [Penstemon davidsonii]